MKKKKLFRNQLNKLKNNYLIFFLPFTCLMQGQIDKASINGVNYCSRNLPDIIHKEKNVRYQSLPENFVSDSIDFNADSSYVFIKERKYLQIEYLSEKLKIKILKSENDLPKQVFVINSVSNKETKITFLENCDIAFQGVKLVKNKPSIIYLKAKFDGYTQIFSIKYYKNIVVLNFDLPEYRKCDP